jgi:hypothetical protein
MVSYVMRGSRGRAYLEQAIGSSQEPGTDWTTIFDSLTPDARSLAFVPARRGSIIADSMLGWGGVWGETRLTAVPTCVYNSNAQFTAIMLLSFTGAFKCSHYVYVSFCGLMGVVVV